ncbi:MAG TPA: M23 family metallopeptidase, partial [Dongiaceae bacterium]
SAHASVTIKAGDSLASAIIRGGVPKAQAYANLGKLKAIDARRLQPGDKLALTFIGDAAHRRLALITWTPRRGAAVRVALLPGGAASGTAVASAADNQPNNTAMPNASAMIVKTMLVHGSAGLPRTLTESGLPPAVCEQVTMALSQLRHPPVHGEAVKIVYQVPADTASAAPAQLRYAAYTGRDGKQHVLRYTALATPAPLQHVDLTPATMVALWRPLPGARISSPFGWRVHPVLHTKLFHKGVDYEAALGTPVVAAADGVVEDFGRRGNYGNYIRLRHSGRLETAYAHLSAFSATLMVGMPVHRGDVIGYVGMTGIATGPHLYYELLVDGRQIDPEGSVLKDAIRHQQVPQTASIPLP